MQVYANAPEQLEQRQLASIQGTIAIKKIHNPDDPDIQAMTLDDFFIKPMVAETDANQFVANGDLWTEVD